jgi:hypothetical protein
MNKTNHKEQSKAELADELKQAYDTVSPFIDKHTAVVCPECKKVCCIDKHSRYDSDDIMFMESLCIDICHNTSGRERPIPAGSFSAPDVLWRDGRGRTAVHYFSVLPC